MVQWNPHGIVEVAGRKFDTWNQKQRIKQITVELTTNEASQAVFKIYDPRFRFIDEYTQGDGLPMLPIRVWMGFGYDLGEPLFKGLIARAERGDTDTTLRCYDMSYKMRQQKNHEYHQHLNDLEIIEKLITRNDLKFVGPDGKVHLPKHDSMMHDFKNDWQHAYERAQEAGFVLYTRGDTVFCKEPAQIGEPLITLVYRKDFILLHDFDLEYKIPENYKGRNKVVRWHARKKDGHRLTGVSSVHNRGHVGVEGSRDVSIHQKPYIDRRSHASKELQREHSFVCTIRSIPPLPNVRPDVRDTIKLLEVGKLWSGPYLCDKVTHELTADSFTTEYSLYRDFKA